MAELGRLAVEGGEVHQGDEAAGIGGQRLTVEILGASVEEGGLGGGGSAGGGRRRGQVVGVGGERGAERLGLVRHVASVCERRYCAAQERLAARVAGGAQTTPLDLAQEGEPREKPG